MLIWKYALSLVKKDGKSSARYEQVSHALASEKGCLSCHEGIEIINDNMQPFLLGFAKKQYGKGAGYECAICHEGNPSSGSKEEAHSSLIPNPSSMWVLHEGKGCAKCHDSKGSITTLMGNPSANLWVEGLCPSSSFPQNLPGY